jgi:quinol monooxygenase YgiN
MSEVVVVGSFKAQPGKEDEGLEAFKALVAPTHAEDGLHPLRAAPGQRRSLPARVRRALGVT